MAACMCTRDCAEAAQATDCRDRLVHARRRRPQAAQPRRGPRVVRENRRRTELDGAYGPQQARPRSELACHINISRPASRICDLLQNTAVCSPRDGMAFARRRACMRRPRTCSVSRTSSCSEAGEQQIQPVSCRMRLCLPAVASCRRCWWLCCSSSARCPGRVDCRPRGSPQWGGPGATDADAARHQVGARLSHYYLPMHRRAGYPGMAVRPDESIFPKREVSFFICHVPEAAQPRKYN